MFDWLFTTKTTVYTGITYAFTSSSFVMVSFVCNTHFPLLINTFMSNSRSMFGSGGLWLEFVCEILEFVGCAGLDKKVWFGDNGSNNSALKII